MADVLFFMRSGWGNIWKQKTIWVFSAISIPGQIFNFFVKQPDSNLVAAFYYLVVNILFLIVNYISLFGVPYAAYCFSNGKVVNVPDTFSAVKKFAWRMLGSSCLLGLVLMPFMCGLLLFGMDRSTVPAHISDWAVFLLLPSSLFSGMWYFTMFEFFAYDGGIRESLKNAWELFTSHFSTLAILGISMTVAASLFTILSGVFTVLIQSGFELTALSDINYINPSAALGSNVLFVFVNRIVLIVLTPFYSSTFALAYLKYTSSREGNSPNLQPLP